VFANQSNEICATVRNTGTAAAGAFTVAFSVDGFDTEVRIGGGLVAGGETAVCVNDPTLRSKDASVTIEVTADSEAEIDESDETNNALSLTLIVNVTYGVTFEVEGSDYAERTVKSNEVASYTLTVRNTGSDPDSFDLTVANLNGADTVALSQTSVLNLAAGASADVTLNVSDAMAGAYRVNVTATSQGNPGVSDAITTVTAVEVEVITLPGYDTPPTDPDEDGLYEDLNGNGRTDFDDVVQFFNFMEWIEANEPTACFDFNGNGRTDFDDIVQLFGEL